MARRGFRLGIARLAGNRTGVGAVEFAVVAPFLLLLYLGASELSIALTLDRKVQHATAMISDIVTQSNELDAKKLAAIYAISTSILTPYDSADLSVRVTSVSINAQGTQSVAWSCLRGTGLTALPAGQTFQLPADFAALTNTTVIVAETRYPFRPIFAGDYLGSFDMGAASYANPRLGEIQSSGC